MLSISSSRSGKKRAEVGWNEIFHTLISNENKRKEISTSVCLELATPLDFLLSNRKSEIAELIGMSGWEDRLTECIANVSAYTVAEVPVLIV